MQFSNAFIYHFEFIHLNIGRVLCQQSIAKEKVTREFPYPSIMPCVSRHEAEAKSHHLQHRLASTQDQLHEEQELRQRRENDALRLAFEGQKLLSALEVERLIK